MFHWIDGHVTTAKGFCAATAHVGLRSHGTGPDLALIAADVPCHAAGVFTRNVVKAAPLIVSAKHLENKKARAIVVNSGNANCCTKTAMSVAESMCLETAKVLNIDPTDVLVASTGVIGVELDPTPIAKALPHLSERLNRTGGYEAASAIMTTDTSEKTAALTYEEDGKTVTIGGIAKGSGMIHPNMGTMLSFITTDANIAPQALQNALIESTNLSFNMVSVDGDTSTNDTVFLLASGLSESTLIAGTNDAYQHFVQALSALCVRLAKMIAADGEGASKLLICEVREALTLNDAQLIAKSIVSSSLLKAAIFGSDANWGRILCAAGYSGASFEPSLVSIYLTNLKENLLVCEDGGGVPFSEEKATELLSAKEVRIVVVLGQGLATAEAYGCDLTYDYVRINGDYRS